MLDEKILSRFWEKVQKTDGCWEWTACKDRVGYGKFGLFGKDTGAHRLSWMIHFGEIPDGLQVLHHCDNPKCVNPQHLFLGTHEDNMRDKVKKNRCISLPGEENGRAKLTEKDVHEIREKAKNGMTLRPLAKVYGISFSHASDIINHKRWAHVE